MRTSRLTLVAALAVAVGLAGLMAPAAARYLPTKRGSTDGDRPDRLDRLAHLIRELLAESDNSPADRAAYEQRVFYKREAPSYPQGAVGTLGAGREHVIGSAAARPLVAVHGGAPVPAAAPHLASN